MRIEKGTIYKLSTNLNLTEVLYVDGTLEFDNTKNVTITTTKNVIVTGKIISDLRSQPDLIHKIYFKDVDMNKFIGGGTEPLDSDVGLWLMGAGTADFKGAHKTEYTNSKGSIPAGAKSIPVVEKNGWKIGDKITIWSGDVKPQLGSRFWDSASKQYLDNYLDCIERRTITGFSGDQVLFDIALRFKHEVFVAEDGTLFYPYVVNETRNIKVHAAEGKRSHIFACAHSHNSDGTTAHNVMKQTFMDVEIYYMGVRKFQPGGAGAVKGIDDIVTGRYALHFHHAGDGTNGSIVQSCSFHDNGGRCAVPHMANGISFIRNTITFNLGDAMWWDFQEMSHNIKYHQNMLVGILWDGVQLGGTAILLGIGDNNDCTENILMYANQGDVDGSGAIQWTTDNEGVWKTHKNIIFCCHNADWTWQNSGRAHDIVDQIAVNCVFALTHGAYGNLYVYINMRCYNSAVKIRASGPTFIRCLFDGMNKLNELVYAQTSAVEGPNKIQECTFKNAPNGIILDVYPHNEENAKWRTVELVNNKYINVNRKYQIIRSNGGSYPGIVPGCAIYTQEGDVAKKIVPMATETTIGKFAPDKYGTGDGLRTEIFKGMNFETKVQDHIRALVREEDWRVQYPMFPNGANYKFLMPDKVNQYPFSFRYTGQVQPYFTGAHRFRLYGGSGFRLWIDNKLVIDSPGNKHDNSEFADSPLITLTALQKYNIKVEVYEPGDRNMGIKLMWELPGKFTLRDVETSQLYSLTGTIPPIDPPIDPPVVITANAGADFKLTGTVGTLDGTKSIGTPTKINWYHDSGPTGWNIVDQNALKTEINRLAAGAHGFRLRLQDATGAVSEDRITVTVESPAPPSFSNKELSQQFIKQGCPTGQVGSVVTYTVPAGKYTASTQALADGMAQNDVNQNGQKHANDTGTCITIVPPPEFGNKLVSQEFTKNDCATGETGTKVTYVVPAGKHTATTQAAADKLAQDDIAANGQKRANEMGTCTKPEDLNKKIAKIVIHFTDNTEQEFVP